MYRTKSWWCGQPEIDLPPKRNWSHVPKIILIAILIPCLVYGGGGHQHATAIYDRAVNETLDTVMSMQDDMRSKNLKMNWAQFNAEVCRRMHVRRTDPWNRK